MLIICLCRWPFLYYGDANLLQQGIILAFAWMSIMVLLAVYLIDEHASDTDR